MTVLLALRGPFSDPTGAWWSIGSLVLISALAAAAQWRTIKRGYLYAAATLFHTSFVIWLVKYHSQRTSSGREFFEANVIALSLSSLLWLWLELRARRISTESGRKTALSFHNLAVLLSTFVVGVIVAVTLTADAGRIPISHSFLFDWLALISISILMFACLWDRDAEYAVAGVYVIGIFLAGLILDYLQLPPRRLTWAAMIFLAIHALVASLMCRGRATLIKWATQLNIPPRMDPSATELGWLMFFNVAAVAVVAYLAFAIDLKFLEWTLRASAALAVSAQTLTFGFMAQGRENRFDRIVTGSTRSKAIAVGFKAGLPFGFESRFDQTLACPVSHHGNP